MKEGKPVKLDQLVDAFELLSMDLNFLLNQKTGEIVTSQELEDNEEDEESDDYIELPSKWELNEYEIMEDFINSLENVDQYEVLARAIQGKGAFGRFRTGIHAFNIQEQWYKHHHDRLMEIAIDWCEKFGLAYE